MIKAKSKKIGAFLTALAVTVSMMPSLAAPSFATETEAAEVTAAEEMMDQTTDSMTEDVDKAPDAEELNYEEEMTPENEPIDAPKVDSSVNILNATNSAKRNVTKWMTLSNKPAEAAIYRGTITCNEIQYLAFRTSNRDSFYQIKLVNSNGYDLYPRFYGPDKEELIWHQSLGAHSSWDFEAYHRGSGCANESKLMKNTAYYLKLETPDWAQNYTSYNHLMGRESAPFSLKLLNLIKKPHQRMKFRYNAPIGRRPTAV